MAGSRPRRGLRRERLPFAHLHQRKPHAWRLPVYEWLLEQARKAGINGGSAFRAIAGFGRHGKLHEQAFFELAGEEPVLVECIAGEVEIERFLRLLRTELPDIFVARSDIECGPAIEMTDT